MSEMIITVRTFEMDTEKVAALKPLEEDAEVFGAWQDVDKQIAFYRNLFPGVRCRDCDVSQKDGTRCLLFAGWEPIEDSDEYELVSAEVEPDGFCKWGKRREDK